MLGGQKKSDWTLLEIEDFSVCCFNFSLNNTNSLGTYYVLSTLLVIFGL